MVSTHTGNLELVTIDGKLTLGGVCVDFDDIEMRLIKRSAHNSNQPLMKAVGKQSQFIIDLTCGYGKDSYLFLCAGKRVKGVERNALVYELLRDGIERGLQNRD